MTPSCLKLMHYTFTDVTDDPVMFEADALHM